MQSKTLRGVLMALTTITVWGATYVVTKGVMSELTAIDVLVTRFTIGFLILATVAKATGQSLMIEERSDLKLFIASGATGVAAYFTLENCALYFTQAANVGVIVSLIPITNVLVMWFFFRDVPLKRQFFIGSAIAVAGSACLTLATDKIGAVSPLGDLLAFLACFAWPLYCVVTRKLSERGYKIIPMTAWTFFFGVLIMLPFDIGFGAKITLSTLTDPGVFMGLAFLGVFASALCYATWTGAVEALGIAKTSLFLYAQPLITVLLSVVFLHETLPPLAIAGIATIFVGLIVAQKGH